MICNVKANLNSAIGENVKIDEPKTIRPIVIIGKSEELDNDELLIEAHYKQNTEVFNGTSETEILSRKKIKDTFLVKITSLSCKIM